MLLLELGVGIAVLLHVGHEGVHAGEHLRGRGRLAFADARKVMHRKDGLGPAFQILWHARLGLVEHGHVADHIPDAGVEDDLHLGLAGLGAGDAHLRLALVEALGAHELFCRCQIEPGPALQAKLAVRRALGQGHQLAHAVHLASQVAGIVSLGSLGPLAGVLPRIARSLASLFDRISLARCILAR